MLKIIGVAAIGSVVGKTILDLSKNKIHKVEWEGISLGAPSNITIYHPEKNKAEIILKNSVKKIYQLENLFSLYKKDSQLSILNREGILLSPDPEMLNLLSISKNYSNITNGAFDITVQPLWNFYTEHFSKYNSVPSNKKVAEILKLVNFNNIEIHKNKIQYAVEGMSSTLNGIAQGYITDRVAEILIESGIKNTLVQIGEYRGVGEHPEGRPWNLLISNPEHTSSIGKLKIKNSSVATSSGIGTIIENTGKYNHIFDPKNGMSPIKHLQNTVVAQKATEADALSTAFLIMNRNESSKIAKDRKIGFEILNNDRKRKIITKITNI